MLALPFTVFSDILHCDTSFESNDSGCRSYWPQIVLQKFSGSALCGYFEIMPMMRGTRTSF